jgi:uncharacterized phosphosugar-binding protein
VHHQIGSSKSVTLHHLFSQNQNYDARDTAVTGLVTVTAKTGTCGMPVPAAVTAKSAGRQVIRMQITSLVTSVTGASGSGETGDFE